MISFLLRLSLFARTLVRLWRRDPDFRTLVILVFFTLLAGTIFYSFVEGWSLVDAFYFSVTTLTTVGLGDLSPATTIGKLFTVVYIFSGLGLLAGFINSIATETLSRQRNEEDQEGTGDVWAATGPAIGFPRKIISGNPVSENKPSRQLGE
jgi:voltage-gated potassium channel